MATLTGSATDRVYTFAFDGIVEIACIRGRSDAPQILVGLSSAKKTVALVEMCNFNESNSTCDQYYFSINPGCVEKISREAVLL